MEVKKFYKRVKKSIKRRLKKRLKKSKLFGKYQKLRKSQYVILYNIYSRILVQKKNEVAMLSDSRKELSGNLAFIDTELKANGYHVSYFFKKSLKEKKSFHEVKTLCKLMARSKYILLDDFYPIIYPIQLRKGTKLIQVWHAMGAFKTVGFSRMGKPGGPSEKSITHRNYTDAITSAESIRKNYAEAFWIDIDKVHATGVPRTDIFFNQNYKAHIKQSIYEKYPIMKNKKVVLFAPTFRGAGQNSAHYNFEWIDFERIQNELPDEYIFVSKMHPFIKNIKHLPEDNEKFLNLTCEREINDLLFVTDVLITDYSSVIFEASLLNINTIFYVPDLEEYVASRDFYYPFEDYTFGQVVKEFDQLIEAIQSPENDIDKLVRFKQYFCEACDGKATKRFVETLFDEVKKK